jgi:hypothetical protein
MNALSHLQVLPMTIEERLAFINQAVDEITSGERNPIETYILLNSVEELATKIRRHPAVKEATIRELTKYGQRTVDFGRFEVQIQERKQYDFSQCCDSEWEELDAQIMTLTEKRKEREAMLKNLTEPVGNIETGEYIYPATYIEQEVITIKQRKGV